MTGIDGRARSALGEVRLLRMRSQKESALTSYTLELSNGCECWAITRRYSEFRSCHVRLAELYGRSMLPPFPPKEPIFQKLLGKSEARSEFGQHREHELHNYLVGLLAAADVCDCPPLLGFLGIPADAKGGSGGSAGSHANALEEDEEIASFSGFRVRLTGEPGGLEVIVRPGSQRDASMRPRRVHLLLRELVGNGDEDDRPPTEEQENAGGRVQKILDLPDEAVDASEEEASAQFSLPPGTFWQVSARGATASEVMSSEVSLRVRAPGEKELASLPASALEAAARHRHSAEAQASGRKRHMVAEIETEAATDEQLDSSVTSPMIKSPVSLDFSALNSAAGFAARKFSGEESPGQLQAAALLAEESAGEAAEAAPQHEENEELAAGDADGGMRSEAGHDEAEPGGAKTRGHKFPLVRQRLPRGPEDHRVVSYRGKVAAAYMEIVKEKQEISIQKAPNRLEKVNGAVCSVPRRFSSVGAAAEDEVQEGMGEVRDLDQRREELEVAQLRQDERRVAQWIFAVTADVGAGEAATGEQTLQAVLRSGEVLCDLINAVWPGRIVGILRGEVKPFRAVENILQFCKACTDVGVDEHSLLAPADLAAGTGSSRNVLRCLFALGAALPEPPEYEGPRLDEGLPRDNLITPRPASMTA